MRIIADLQIHSKYARATSKDLSLANLEKYAKIKGIDLLGVGDFQHPKHNEDIKSYLKKEEKGILYSESGFPFLWQTEVSLMYSQGGRGRAVHLLVFAPNGKTADQIINYLKSKGRVDYDGRPIFGISCHDFVRDMKKIDDRIEIIPAHCMTPYFGLYGSKSGFDTLKECFGDQAENIHAIESGMSADPAMLWRFKENVNVVSFSDAHSFWPWRIGREATIFDIPELSYDNIINAIRTGIGLVGTLETYPEYGKYHYDGHRDCKFSSSPSETRKLSGICPVCKKPLTIGVEYRVEQLAKEKEGYKPKNAKIFYKLLPLHELIAFVHNTPLASKKTWTIYNDIMSRSGNELRVLLDEDKDALTKKNIDAKLIEIIMLNRSGNLRIKPGFDGEYGVIELGAMEHTQSEKKPLEKQRSLF